MASSLDRVEELIDAIRDSDSITRASAAKELGEIGDARAVVPLIGLLQDAILKVRIEVIKALGDMADNRAVEPLIEILEHDYAELQTEAAVALGKIGDSRAVEPLSGAIEYAESAQHLVPRRWVVRRGIPYDDPTYEYKVASVRILLSLRAKQAIEKIGEHV